MVRLKNMKLAGAGLVLSLGLIVGASGQICDGAKIPCEAERAEEATALEALRGAAFLDCPESPLLR